MVPVDEAALMSIFDLPGQGWLQLQELLLAFILSALVGLEREIRQKSAGLRTYSLVGVSAALFMLISKYGFMDVLVNGRVVLDPSRVAAQIVSGIGFIGGGVIFMRRDAVKGLTTAASVWLTAALGMACGAGLPILAIATTVIHVVIMFIFPKVILHLPRDRGTSATLRIVYEDGRGLLRTILVTCSQQRFVIGQCDVDRDDQRDVESPVADDLSRSLVALSMHVKGARPVGHLIEALSNIDGVYRVTSGSNETELE